MPVTKVACPSCGEPAYVTVNSKDDEIRNIHDMSGRRGYKSACKECGRSIYYDLG